MAYFWGFEPLLGRFWVKNWNFQFWRILPSKWRKSGEIPDFGVKNGQNCGASGPCQVTGLKICPVGQIFGSLTENCGPGLRGLGQVLITFGVILGGLGISNDGPKGHILGFSSFRRGKFSRVSQNDGP